MFSKASDLLGLMESAPAAMVASDSEAVGLRSAEESMAPALDIILNLSRIASKS